VDPATAFVGPFREGDTLTLECHVPGGEQDEEEEEEEEGEERVEGRSFF